MAREVVAFKKRKLKDVPTFLKGFFKGSRIPKDEKKLLDNLDKNLQTLFLTGAFLRDIDKPLEFREDYEKNVDQATVRINTWQKKYSKVKLKEVV